MKKTLITLLTAVTVLGSSMTAFAAPETMPDGTIFDAEYYALIYPDVANAIGTDKDALYNHYVTYGKAEGRVAYAPTTEQPVTSLAETPVQSQNKITGTTPIEALILAVQQWYLPFWLSNSIPTSETHISRATSRDSVWQDTFSPFLVYDTEGRLVAYKESPIIYNEQGQIKQVFRLSLFYNEQGLLTRINSYDNIKETYFYDEQGRLSYSYMDGDETRKTDYIYDEQGKLIKVAFFNSRWNNGHYKTYEYDESGRVIGSDYYEKTPNHDYIHFYKTIYHYN